MLVFWLVQSALAQEATQRTPGKVEAAKPALSAEEALKQRMDRIKAGQQEVSAAIESVEKALGAGAEPSGSDKAAALNKQLETLKQLDSVFERQLEALQEADTLSVEERKYREAAETLETSDDPVPVSELDTASAELSAQTTRLSALTAIVDQTRSLVDQARADLAGKQKELSAYEGEKEGSHSVEPDSARLQLARWELKQAEEMLRLRELELEREKRKLAAAESSANLLERRLSLSSGRVQFEEAEFLDRLQQIEKEELELERELRKTDAQQIANESRLHDARQRMASAPTDKLGDLSEEVEARRLAKEALDAKIAGLTRRGELLTARKTAWQRRYAIINGIGKPGEWVKWKEEATDALTALEQDERSLNLLLQDWKSQAISIENKISNSERDAGNSARWLDQQRQSVQSLVDHLRERDAYLEKTRRLLQKVVESVNDRTEHRSWRELAELVLDTELNGNRVRDWVLAIISVSGLFSLLIFVRNFLITALQRYLERQRNVLVGEFFAGVRRTRTFFLLMISVFASALLLHLDPTLSSIVRRLTVVALIFQVSTWVSYFLRVWVFDYLGRKTKRDETSLGALSIFNSLSQLAVWSLALLLTLQNFGIDITALAAGLGIGGVAVALALQRILGDLLSSLSIAFDKPFVAGDFIIFDQLMGTVEHIGIKTTRIRSLDGEQIICANSDLLNTRIRNFKRMKERRAAFQIGLVYHTPYEKLVKVPGLLRSAVENQANVRFDRAHFKAYGDFSLLFEVVYYVLSADYNDYMNVQEAINLTIFECFQNEGLQFALPTRSLYVQALSQIGEAPLSALKSGEGKAPAHLRAG
ncbi:mechanosensitive ion channel domain-containing protein [Methylocaldum sp.]|uniref:mechanosensitive ion channel domain-containing protein n=1 Tax=Methylocaldum sp. TaxID=1969727 RepID=UPI002D6FA49D|nr:mechanosensitive ion channel domain-containing protein [Methylocaldum sp.]HYE33807.1 mechanosensitive ion channel domain-containing protein [Methylocaldum sp.]